MKTKHLFLSALTCLAFAACSNDDDAVQNPQSENGDKAYIAINFSMPGSGATTRWADDDINNYESAKEYELAVSDISFFFFKENGEQAAVPCNVDVKSENNLWGGNNHEHSGSNAQMTDDKSTNVILTVKDPEDVAKVVAVLNPTAQIKALATGTTSNNTTDGTLYTPSENTFNTTTTLIQLGQLLLSESTTEQTKTITTPIIETVDKVEKLQSTSPNLLMSNSVYYESDGDAAIQATEITANNLRTTVASAKAAPITIHVERIWARVNVTLGKDSDQSTEGLYKAKTLPDSNGSTQAIQLNGEDLYIQLGNWWLNNTNKDAYIIKQYTSKPTYSWAWNDPADYRSYWASAYNSTSNSKDDFAHYTYSSATAEDKYCLENTANASFTQTFGDKTVNFTTSTQAVIAAKVGVLKDGSFTATDVVEYAGELYTVNGIKNVMLSGDNLKTVYKKTGNDTYTTVTVDDLEFVYNTSTVTNATTGLRDYQAYLQLKTKDSNGADITYYKSASSSNSYTADEIASTNATLKDAVVKYWKGGQTYFFTKILHYDANNNENDLYAVVRNHLYKISITGVSGLGTPVPDECKEIIPEIPDDSENKYLSCKIAVLKYRVVSQNVSLGGDNSQQ